MASVKDTASFFANGTTKQFDYCLKLYPQVLKLKAEARCKKPEELVRLDDWYQNELPKRIKQRGKDAHMVHEELVQTMKWKQSRGKFYPQLSYLVKVNTPRAVMQETKKAFRKLPNLEQAITALSNLKGVGTTMASALLAAAAPDSAPFMADECLMAIPEIEGIDYTTKEYLNFVQHIQTTVNRLNSEKDSTSSWSPHRVELALWTHYVATDLKPELLEDIPQSNLMNLSTKKFSTNADDDIDDTDDDDKNGIIDDIDNNITTTSSQSSKNSLIIKQTNGSSCSSGGGGGGGGIGDGGGGDGIGNNDDGISDNINDTDENSISNDSQDNNDDIIINNDDNNKNNININNIIKPNIIINQMNSTTTTSTKKIQLNNDNDEVNLIKSTTTTTTNQNQNQEQNKLQKSSSTFISPTLLVVDDTTTVSSIITADDDTGTTTTTNTRIEQSDESNFELLQLPANGSDDVVVGVGNNNGNGALDSLDDSTRSDDSLEKPITPIVAGNDETNDSDSYNSSAKRSLDCESSESNSQPESKKIRSE